MHLTGYSELRPPPPTGDAGRYVKKLDLAIILAYI